MTFVDLDRNFAPLQKDQEPSLDIGRFWGGRYSGWLNWEELRRRRRVILLAEAASGKTEEFRHQCGELQELGKPAFFLRIEELADQGTETALDGASVKLFETWLAGSGEGWFFLDSVDEARLNRKSFDTALRRFAKDVGTGLERAHVYVSCRVTDCGKAERDAEPPAWTPAETLTFERQLTAPAKTGADLLRVTLGVLLAIGQSLTKADFTSRALLERAKDEEEVQHWLAEQMNARAKDRFQVFREPEVAIGDKPDLIAASTSAPCQVAIEVKHGGMGWSARDLEKALRVQLSEDYLKPENRRHGVLVITHHRDRRWLRVGDKKPISFDDLIKWLSGVAASIANNSTGRVVAACVGIDAWRTGNSVSPASKQKRRFTSKPQKRNSASKPRGVRSKK